jgi:hypothetical protein
MSLHPDYKDILAAFAQEAVRYLVVGGYAVGFHGQPRFTKDIDLWVEPSDDNMRRVQRALEAFGAPSAVLDNLWSAKSEDVLWMGAPPVRIDILKGVPGGNFERAYQTRVVAKWDAIDVSIVDREELIRLKRASGRPQDMLDADQLEQAG